MLNVGEKAPDIYLEADDANKYCLNDFKGKKIIVYFYPKDNTSGCTIESNSINSVYEELKSLNAEVIGISPDSTISHLKFRKKCDLKFILLADTENLMAKAFGVWSLKKSFGKQYMGIVRTTFIIDEQGIVIKVYEKVKPNGHGDEILKFLRTN